MNETQLNRLRLILTRLSQIFPKEITADAIRLYATALEGADLDRVEKAIAEIVREETRFPVPSVILKYYNGLSPQLTHSNPELSRDAQSREQLSNVMFVLGGVLKPDNDDEAVLMQRMRAVCASCQTAPIWIEFRSLTPHDQTKFVIRWWRDIGVKQILIDKVDQAVTSFFQTSQPIS